MNYIIEIPGKPIGKARPRFVRRGSFVGTYNPQETEEGRFLFEVQKQWRRPPLEGPLKVQFAFEMPIPKSTPKKKFAAIMEDKVQHTKKPDISNLIKFVEDCLNGVVWRDDSQIFCLTAIKFYFEKPKTSITIEEV